MTTRTSLTTCGLAGALLLAATALAGAQRNYVDNDPWTHTTTAAANGQCWNMTDSSRGIGYWTNCPQKTEAAPTMSRRARHARAESTGPLPRRER